MESVEIPGANLSTRIKIVVDSTGFPPQQFNIVHAVGKSQRGVVSQGDHSAAYFTTIYLAENYNEYEVKKAISSVPELTEQISSIDREARLLSTVSISPELWRCWSRASLWSIPSELIEFKEKRAKSTTGNDDTRVIFPRTGGDVFFFVKAERQDLCYELTERFLALLGDTNVQQIEQTSGFRYMGGKDLTGFIDGTRQPNFTLRALGDVTVIQADDGFELEVGADINNNNNDNTQQTAIATNTASPHEGGSYMLACRFVHNLKKFFALSDAEKSNLIGRDYTTVRPHNGFDPRPENPLLEHEPENSHVQRGFGAMYRQAWPYKTSTEAGLYFLAFSRSAHEIDTALNRMSGHYAADGSTDALLSVTAAVRCQYFYCPSLVELKKLV